MTDYINAIRDPTVNTAAWLRTPGAALVVAPAPVPTAGAGEIVVRSRAVAVNPLDWIIQRAGFTYRWLRYPAILGADVAGVVHEVGAGVERFSVGDRVIGYAVGVERDPNRPAEGAFQELVVLREDLAAPLPAEISFERGVVLPLAVSTAASALFRADGLGLRLPPATATPAESVLAWGGSTSVGMNAVQLAVAAGYDVVSTASPRNAELVSGLGARAVVDHRSPIAVREITAALGGRRLAGALAVGAGSTKPSLEVVASNPGARRLVSASTAVSLDRLRPGRAALVRATPTLLRVAGSAAMTQLRARAARVRASMVWGSSLKEDQTGPAIWRDFLPAALAEGRYQPAPPARVVGTGLADLQHALDLQRRGVSAEKLVVRV